MMSLLFVCVLVCAMIVTCGRFTKLLLKLVNNFFDALEQKLFCPRKKE